MATGGGGVGGFGVDGSIVGLGTWCMKHYTSIIVGVHGAVVIHVGATGWCCCYDARGSVAGVGQFRCIEGA